MNAQIKHRTRVTDHGEVLHMKEKLMLCWI